MAPLLYILALDGLYRVNRARSDIDGMVLQSCDLSEDITVSGYADDTAIYLRGSDGIPQILTILENFCSRVWPRD